MGSGTTRRRPRIALLIDNLTAEYEVQIRRAVERAGTHHDVDVLTVVGQRIDAPVALEVAQNGIYRLIGPDAADGVIVVSSTLGHFCGPEGIQSLCRSYSPLPVCSIGLTIDGVPSLVVDNAAGMRLAVSHLVESHRCRRVACIAGPRGSAESDQRLAGYHSALAKAGLTVDPRLVVHGDFTVSSGGTGMRKLLERGAEFDAVVAANDNMALGTLDVLRTRGRQVPGEVRVCGFDDINNAHFARPSLTTVRQPIRWLGMRAVEVILEQFAGESVSDVTSGPVELVRRESCGCGFQEGHTARPSGPPVDSVLDVVRERRQSLYALISQAVVIPNNALGDWPWTLLDALERDLSGDEGCFMLVFESLLERAQAEGASLDEFQRVVSTLRREIHQADVRDREQLRHVERVWHAARVLVGAASIRAQGRSRIETEHASAMLGRSAELFATSLSLPVLRNAMAEALPPMQVRRAAISLCAGESCDLKPFLVLRDGVEAPTPTDPIAATKLAPEFALDLEVCEHSVVVPLTFETETLGVAVLGAGALPTVYESLRAQIGSAIKSSAMHRKMVAQVAARERLEQERLHEEARVAARIQTSMGPSVLDVPGLDIAATMIPAAQVGGDYYDVLPTADGGWLTIGDVAGHGLAAGLVMLMIQSMIASLTRLDDDLAPSRLLVVLNRALYDNVRLRLGRDDHATLTVLRYRRDGRVTFAGAHEDLIIWRASTGHVETVPSPGFWVGAVPDVKRMTSDEQLQLHDGDIMVLYTDGVTEPRNAHREQFSLERLCETVEAAARLGVTQIRDRIVDEVRSWSSSLDDDVTLVVARYRAES